MPHDAIGDLRSIGSPKKDKMPTITEKKVITEVLELYKEFSCLWDNSQVEYNNKAARDRAYEILVEKYREFNENASILDIKKKIEHLRTTYRREERKVLQSRLNGDEEEYAPSLWYFNLLTFLKPIEPTSSKEVPVKVEFKPKKRKTEVSAVYLPEQDEDDDDNFEEDEVYIQQDNNSVVSNSYQLAEAEAFGTTVGLQLKELDPMQRVFAEKLISDAIYQARLNKLNENSTIVANGERIIRPSF